MKKKNRSVHICKGCGLQIEDGYCDSFGCGGMGPPTKPTKREWKKLQKEADKECKETI